MAASYPTAVKTFSTKSFDDEIEAEHPNSIQDEVTAIENGLLTGIAHDLLPDTDTVRKLGSAAKSWDGSEIVNLNASNLASGTIPAARIPTPTPVIQIDTFTGPVNDFVLTPNVSTLYVNNATLRTYQGFTAGYAGQRVRIVSNGAGHVELAHQNGSSTAANRIINFATVGTTMLAAGVGVAEIEYDAVTARWRLASHSQGAWITRAFAAGNFSAGSGNWTVGSASRDAFWLKDRTLYYGFNVSGTTSATPTTIIITIPNSYRSVDAASNWTYYIALNGASVAEPGYGNTAGAGSTTFNFQRIGNPAFGTGTVDIRGELFVEIQ